MFFYVYIFIDENHWLYLATLIFKGSDYIDGGRELFQEGKDCPFVVPSLSTFPNPIPYDRSLSDPLVGKNRSRGAPFSQG